MSSLKTGITFAHATTSGPSEADMGHAPSSWLLVTLCSPSLLTFLAPPACLLCFSSFPFPVALNSCSLYCGVVSLGFTWRTKWSGGICWSAGCFSCQAQRRGANASSQRVKKGGSAASRGETAERSRERQGRRQGPRKAAGQKQQCEGAGVWWAVQQHVQWGMPGLGRRRAVDRAAIAPACQHSKH